jgi:hypothetical protein
LKEQQEEQEREREAARCAAEAAAEAEAQRLKEEQDVYESGNHACKELCSFPLITESEHHSVSSIFSNDIGLDASDGWGFDCSVASNQYFDDKSISDCWEDDLDLLDI